MLDKDNKSKEMGAYLGCGAYSKNIDPADQGLSEREAHLDQEGDLFSYLQYVVKSVDRRTC